MTTIEDLKTYYANTLIAQYRTKPRARDTIKAVAQEAWCDGLILQEAECFNIDTAIGAQLDIIGRIVGVNEFVNGLDLEHTFFEFTSYFDSPDGVEFDSYADGFSEDLFSRYFIDTITTMTDDQMRSIIKLKIVFNVNPRNLKYIKEALYVLFAGIIDVVDNKDLSLTFHVYDPLHKIMAIADFIGILPRSMGTSYNIVTH